MLKSMSQESRKRMGRPPEGAGRRGEPEKIRDYPRLLITIRPSVKAHLRAIAEHENRPVWKVVEAAIQFYGGQLPLNDRRAIEVVARRLE
jgi:hypothetical protein